MKNFLLLAILSVIFVSCNKESIKGSGATTSEHRNLSGFSAVSTNGSTNVYIKQGDDFDVEVSAYGNLVPYLETISQNGTLVIRYKNNTNVRNDNSQVFITMPRITGLNINGSANITSTGNFPAVDQFNASINGSGTIKMDSAKASHSNISISGSGDVKCFPLLSENVKINISGSGNVETHVTGNLDVTISGSGTVYYKGNPSKVTNNISGSGKLISQ